MALFENDNIENAVEETVKTTCQIKERPNPEVPRLVQEAYCFLASQRKCLHPKSEIKMFSEDYFPSSDTH